MTLVAIHLAMHSSGEAWRTQFHKKSQSYSLGAPACAEASATSHQLSVREDLQTIAHDGIPQRNKARFEVQYLPL